MFKGLLLVLIIACSISAPVAIAAVDINAGMSAQWTFEEGSGGVVRDTSDNNNNAVLVARGGGETLIPAILARALRDGRKGDPLHKCCGKNALGIA